MLQFKQYILKLFVWFEENTEQVYRNAVRISMLIWLALLFIVILLIGYFLATRDILPLSAMAISLSAMVASLMAWYSIEKDKRTALKNEEKNIRNDFLRFYIHSFIVYRTILEAVKYEKPNLPKEIPLMVVSTVEQYLAEYPKYLYFHLLLNANENRIVAEQMFGLSYVVGKLRRAVNEEHGHITRQGVKEALNSLDWILKRALKRPFDEFEFKNQFNNAPR